MRQIATRENNPNKWTMQATCTGNGWNQDGKSPCLALFELDAGDIYSRVHHDYGGGSDTYYGFICPNCGCFTEISDSKLPSYVRANAKKY